MPNTADFDTIEFYFLDGTKAAHPNTVSTEGVSYNMNWRINLSDRVIFYPHHTIKKIVVYNKGK